MKELIEKKLKEYRSWMKETRRHLHMYPEVGDCEYETTAYIDKLLNEMGIKTEHLLNTGVLGILEPPEGASGGKCIAIRADIDALPIEEGTDLPFKSKNAGVMHACGHDMHMAALLCTAKILSSPEVHSKLTAPVKFIFQPAEETVGGAARMIKAGCLESPYVSHVLGYHVAPEYPAGTIAVRRGYTHASSDMFEITVHGMKSHGAYPAEGVDAIVAASQIVTAVQSIVARNVAASDSCVITIGKFHAGTAGNIICDLAELTGTMRTTSAEVREHAMKRLKEVSEGIAEAMGCNADVRFKPGYIAQHNDDAVSDVVNETAAEVIGRENIITKEFPSMGVEDFAFYSAERPSAFFFVGTGYRDRTNYGIHHEKFEADESALDVAVKIEVFTALKLMNS
jgi:amidohydrolase